MINVRTIFLNKSLLEDSYKTVKCISDQINIKSEITIIRIDDNGICHRILNEDKFDFVSWRSVNEYYNKNKNLWDNLYPSCNYRVCYTDDNHLKMMCKNYNIEVKSFNLTKNSGKGVEKVIGNMMSSGKGLNGINKLLQMQFKEGIKTFNF